MLEPDQKQRLLREMYQRQAAADDRDAEDENRQEILRAAEALAEDDCDPDRYVRLAACYEGLNRQREALSTLDTGLRRCPPTPQLYHRSIRSLLDSNRTGEAIELAAQAGRLFPDDWRFRLEEYLSLPLLYDTPEEMQHCRERFVARLEQLDKTLDLSTPEAKKSALAAIAKHVNFFLGYQGQNDLALQRQYGRMVRRIMAANYPRWVEPLPMPPSPPDGRLRIGYLSAHFRRHSVLKNHGEWLTHHDRKRFRIFAYSMGKQVDADADEVRRNADSFRLLSGDLEAACAAILADRLHVLMFVDIGMVPIMTQLAALRLAPLQCATWGHPITSGLDTVEYFFSNELMEPQDAQEHYLEKLVLLPGIGICYRKPVIPTVLMTKTRRDFGLREDAVVYLCCQSAFKYLPQHDDVFAQIAKRVPRAQFAFLQPNDLVAADFRQRLKRAFSAAGVDFEGRCIFLPKQALFHYWNLNLVSDVYLDSLEWSGGNTTMEAIACKLPVVTLPGSLMRGRHSYGILRQLGITETIASDKSEYVSIAARLGLDREWRRMIVDRIVEGHPRLYMDLRSVRALEDFYTQAVEERWRACEGVAAKPV